MQGDHVDATRRRLLAGMTLLGGSVAACGGRLAGETPRVDGVPTMMELARGLRLPESPVWLDDGGLLVAEVLGGSVVRIGAGGEAVVLAQPGGGPNGLAIGPDGCCYVCNNGGVQSAPDAQGVLRTQGLSIEDGVGRIERIDRESGRVEVLYAQCEGRALRAPNDLVFDRHGGFWFTDMGKSYEDRRERGRVCYARADGRAIRTAIFPLDGCNGIGLSADERTLYVTETFSGELLAFDVEAPGRIRPQAGSAHGGRIVGRAGPGVRLDGLALDADGTVCVAAIGGTGGILAFAAAAPDVPALGPLPDPLITSLRFGGADLRTLIVTMAWSGRVVALPWPVAGRAPAFRA